MSQFNNIYAVIVEDNPSDADVLQSLLARLGVESDWVEGREALAILSEARPQVVFVDLEMPMINGYEILQSLLDEPAFADMRIVAYTSHSSEMAAAKEAGFHSFLGKPLKGGQFASQLERILMGEPVWEVR